MQCLNYWKTLKLTVQLLPGGCTFNFKKMTNRYKYLTDSEDSQVSITFLEFVANYHKLYCISYWIVDSGVKVVWQSGEGRLVSNKSQQLSY